MNMNTRTTYTKYGLDAIDRSTPMRWLWNEREQLVAHHISHDIHKLCQVAAQAVGSRVCAHVAELSEGQYNKVLLLTMNDGKEAVVKLPYQCASRSHYTTASEVATMDFLRNAHIPVPRIHAWKSTSYDNDVGAEYIVMERQRGIPLQEVWHQLGISQKSAVVTQVISFERRLASIEFLRFGSLYYKHDLPEADEDTALYINEDGDIIHSDDYRIGPTCHRSFFEYGKASLNVDRGPWNSIEEYVSAIAYREIASVDRGLKYSYMPEGLFHGPRQYQPSIPAKMLALSNYIKVAADILPEPECTNSAVLWHNGLRLQDIFVDENNLSQITGILDWQAASICPLYEHVKRPECLDFDGPLPSDVEVLSLPSNFHTLRLDEQREVITLQQAQTLHKLYMTVCHQDNPRAYIALRQKDSLRHQVTVMPGLIHMDYEPYLNQLLREVEREWPNLVGQHDSRQCPLQFSIAEIRKQERDEELWATGVELMNRFVADVGGAKHWDGRVRNVDYEMWREQLDGGIQRFLERECRSSKERDQWLKVLPFIDAEDVDWDPLL